MNPRSRALKIAVLAAGFSVRLGQSKALARVCGTSLLQRTLDTVAPLADGGILVIVPAASTSYRLQVASRARLLPNLSRATGLASSVRLAVRHAGSASALLLLPVDLARLEYRDLQRLVTRWRGAPTKIVANDSGAHGGSPLILPRRYFSLAQTLTGDAGLRVLLAEVPRNALVRVALPSAAFDVDTPTALAAARRQCRSSGKVRSAATA